ncbi:hypothetical protein [Paraburkholderia caballeronis]|nr:hypothetical protein [Paraburkholderia caballeronis]
MIRAARDFTDAHPLISMLIGWLLLFAFAMAVLPPDPPYLDQPHHPKGVA